VVVVVVVVAAAEVGVRQVISASVQHIIIRGMTAATI
jgi:hypothetical protein